jgi:hypothetical protein
MKFIKRLSLDPRRLGSLSPGGNRCPGIWELDTGNFAVIGEDITKKVKKELPSEIMLGQEERIILLPREVLQSAKPNIPES